MVLIGYWPLDESSGNTTYDQSRFGNNGTIYDGGDSTVPGANGILGQNAYSFDGNNNYVEFGDKTRFEMTAQRDISVSIWAKLTNSGSNDGLISKANTPSNKGWEIMIDQGEILPWFGGTSYSQDGGTIDDQNWHHIVVVWNREGYLTRYVDGSQWGSRDDISSISGNDYSSDDPLTIGSQANERSNTGNYKLQGNVSEARLYNHALTQQEIQYLYSVGKKGRHVSSTKQI